MQAPSLPSSEGVGPGPGPSRPDRPGPGPRLVRLEDQDRARWDRAALTEADRLITGCLRAQPDRPGRYVLQAAIASLYAQAPSYERTDWGQLVTLYDALLRVWPSPVVALNRTVRLARSKSRRSPRRR
jgi:RNA polymerase sigma-70 factor, ECF subfamily